MGIRLLPLEAACMIRDCHWGRENDLDDRLRRKSQYAHILPFVDSIESFDCVESHTSHPSEAKQSSLQSAYLR